MKNLSFLLLAGSLLACSTTSPRTTATQPITAPAPATELTYKQQTTIALAPSRTVQATLAEVSDSRCPPDVQCITAGYVAIGISLTDGQAAPLYLRLCLGCNARNQPGANDSVAVTLHQKPYWARPAGVPSRAFGATTR